MKTAFLYFLDAHIYGLFFSDFRVVGAVTSRSDGGVVIAFLLMSSLESDS